MLAGGVVLAVLPERVPLRGREVTGHDGEDLALLEVQVLEQRSPELLEESREALGPLRGRLGHPPRQCGIQHRDELLDARMLVLHGVDQLGGGRRPFEQQRPEQLVLSGVVDVQRL
jgi:hypothetical protein